MVAHLNSAARQYAHLAKIHVPHMQCSVLHPMAVFAHACRNQGTESIRAPEMLLMPDVAESDSQSQASQAGAPCDVWALGCLLYELVTGTLLFPSEPDWSKFYITVTDAKKVTSVIPSALSHYDTAEGPMTWEAVSNLSMLQLVYKATSNGWSGQQLPLLLGQ